MVWRSQAMTPILSGENNHGLTFGQTVAPSRPQLCHVRRNDSDSPAGPLFFSLANSFPPTYNVHNSPPIAAVQAMVRLSIERRTKRLVSRRTTMIHFQCSHCGKEVEVEDAYGGSRGQCPGCGQEIAVPQAADPGGATMSGAAAPPPAGRPVAVLDQQAAPKKTSGMAIASLVCGLLGCLGITAILGVIFGLLGLRQVNRSEGRVGGMGLAIAGLVLSGIMLLGAVPMLAAILLPNLAA
ncbi:MAG: DUF4190 domain-containing protein, partial [Anaerolineaceae bacterium]|nr:DUF4190 domain-containing protein [Anaerolineaceae bacterium]